MRTAMWIIAIFGAIVMLGGAIGYFQAQSLISLVVGSFFGIALLMSAFALMNGINTAHYVALLLAVLLTLFFHYRFLQTGAFMPAGMLAMLSCIVSVCLLVLRPRRL